MHCLGSPNSSQDTADCSTIRGDLLYFVNDLTTITIAFSPPTSFQSIISWGEGCAFVRFTPSL